MDQLRRAGNPNPDPAKTQSTTATSAASESASGSAAQTQSTTKMETVSAPPATDSELDVTSEDFNPFRALYAQEYRVTRRQPKVRYQNLAALDSAYKRHGIWNLNKPVPTPANPVSKTEHSSVEQKHKSSSVASNTPTLISDSAPQRRFEQHQLPIVGGVKHRHQRNIFAQMSAATGPMAVLYRCVQERSSRRVRVLVRREHGIRGSVQGRLLLFDKHWNLVLSDVEEVWRRRKYQYSENKTAASKAQDCTQQLRELDLALPERHVKSVNRKTVEIKRYLPQLMIRGEQVVLVILQKNSRATETAT